MSIITAEALDRNLEAVDLYRRGYSIGAIAAYQGRGREPITRILRTYGVEVRASGRRGSLRLSLPPLGAAPETRAYQGQPCTRCGLLVQVDDWFCPECHEELAAGLAWDPSKEVTEGEDNEW